MTSRFGLGPILAGHLWALRAPGATRTSWADRSVFLGIPIIGGVVSGLAVWLGMPVSNGVSPLLSALALLVGGMMTTFVFLTNLRVKVDESKEQLAYRRTLQKLIAGTVASALYIAVLALSAALLLVGVATLDWLRQPAVAPFTVGVVAAVGAHLAINMLSMFRRLYAVYHDVFLKDFGPDLSLTDGEDLPKRRVR